MTFKEYEELKRQIQLRYDADIAAVDRVFRISTGEDLESAESQSEPKPRSMPSLKRSKKLTPEEKRAKKAAYMKAYHAAHSKKTGKAGRRQSSDGENGLAPEKFRKFLVPGPMSHGGNG